MEPSILGTNFGRHALLSTDSVVCPPNYFRHVGETSLALPQKLSNLIFKSISRFSEIPERSWVVLWGVFFLNNLPLIVFLCSSWSAEDCHCGAGQGREETRGQLEEERTMKYLWPGQRNTSVAAEKYLWPGQSEPFRVGKLEFRVKAESVAAVSSLPPKPYLRTPHNYILFLLLCFYCGHFFSVSKCLCFKTHLTIFVWQS